MVQASRPAFSIRGSFLVCLAASILGVGLGHAAGKRTASQLFQIALADASASGSVHELTSEVSGETWFQASDDVSLRDGRQDIRRSGGVHAHVRLLGPVAYISGNQQTLVSYFGLPRSVAQKIGVRWVRIPSSDHAWYPTVAADATLLSALSQVTPAGPLVELPASELDGKSVIGIRGNIPKGFRGGDTDTTFVTQSAHPLLVAAIFARSGQKMTSTFSHWGESASCCPRSTRKPQQARIATSRPRDTDIAGAFSRKARAGSLGPLGQERSPALLRVMVGKMPN
jgi:hypothetical protein